VRRKASSEGRNEGKRELDLQRFGRLDECARTSSVKESNFFAAKWSAGFTPRLLEEPKELLRHKGRFLWKRLNIYALAMLERGGGEGKRIRGTLGRRKEDGRPIYYHQRKSSNGAQKQAASTAKTNDVGRHRETKGELSERSFKRKKKGKRFRGETGVT